MRAFRIPYAQLRWTPFSALQPSTRNSGRSTLNRPSALSHSDSATLRECGPSRARLCEGGRLTEATNSLRPRILPAADDQRLQASTEATSTRRRQVLELRPPRHPPEFIFALASTACRASTIRPCGVCFVAIRSCR
jgi:hypothetical protein